MSRSALALLLLVACSHAKSVGEGEPSGTTAGGGGARSVNEATKPDEKSPPIAASPQGILRPRAVRELQEALIGKGYAVRSTGDLDAKTREQLALFQRKNGLADTGLPDRESLRRLGLDPDEVYKTR